MKKKRKLSRGSNIVDELLDEAFTASQLSQTKEAFVSVLAHSEQVCSQPLLPQSQCSAALSSKIIDTSKQACFPRAQFHNINIAENYTSGREYFSAIQSTMVSDFEAVDSQRNEFPGLRFLVSQNENTAISAFNDKMEESSSNMQNMKATDFWFVSPKKCSFSLVDAPLIGSSSCHSVQHTQVHPIENLEKKQYRREAFLRWKTKQKLSRIHCRKGLTVNTLSVTRKINQNFPPSEQSDMLSQQTPGAQNEHRSSLRRRAPAFRKKRSGRTPVTGRDLLDLIAEAPDVLPRQNDCPHCGAKKFYSETSNLCCSDGDIVLAQNKLPAILKELLTSLSEEAELFRAYIRTYNNHFGFTSFGVKCDRNLLRNDKGVYTFRVQGQVYHFLNDLIPDSDCAPNLQLYFHDTENEVSNRLAVCPRLSETIIRKIIFVLEENPYAKFFRSLKEVPNLDNYQIVLKTLPGVDQRVYNKPAMSQVAALWVEGEENGETSRRNIRVHTHGGHSRNIGYYYGCYDPLQYPLMFPFGDLGWHQGIPKKGLKSQNRKWKRKRNAADSICPANSASVDELLQNEEDVMSQLENDPNFVSLREYYAYKLQMRDTDESLLLHFARLFVLRCRIGVVLTDLTGTLNCVISGEDAEKLIPFTSIQLKEANENGIPIDQELAEAIKKHTIVCFLRTYDSDFQGQIQKRNSALKVYTLEELQHHSSNLITYPQTSGLLEQPATPAGKQEKNKGKDEFFSPTTKLVLEEITSVSSATPKASPSAHGVKRSLSFIGQHPKNESASAEATPPATEECSTDQPPEPTSTEPMPTDPDVKPSPSKKHKDD